MKYPCNYDLLREEEMVYIAGGSALDAFNYLFGDWFRDMLLSDIRNATWGSMQQLNVQPVVDQNPPNPRKPNIPQNPQ